MLDGARIVRLQGVNNMTTKEEKVKDISAAIKRSAEAKKVKATAKLLPDGRIEYSIMGKTPAGRPYRMKVSLNKILSYLWGDDMRRLKAKYGR